MTHPRLNQKRILYFAMAGLFLSLILVQAATAEYFVTPTNYWQLEQVDPENEGVLDDVGGLTGTCATGACPSQDTAGQVANAFLFDGTNDVVTFASNPAFNFAAGADFTIELWMKRDGIPSARQVLIGRDDSGNQTQWWVAVDKDDGTAVTSFVDADGGDGPVDSLKGFTNVADNQWHHIVVVRNGGTADSLKIYVDGVLEGVQDHSGTFTSTDNGFDSTSDVTLGNLPGSGTLWYGGLLDNVAVYAASALTADQVAQNYLNALNNHDLDEAFAPVFANVSVSDTAVVGFPATLSAKAAGNPMPVYASSDLPSGAVDAVIDASGIISWTPSSAEIGPNAFNVTASNSMGAGVNSQSWSVDVPDLCTSTLDAHWKLEEDGGPYQEATGTVADAIAGTTPPTFTTGQVGSAQSFAEAADSSIIIPSNGVFDWPAGASFSIELWMKRDGVPSGLEVLMGRNDDVGSTQWWIGVRSNGTAAVFLSDADDTPESSLKGYSVVTDNAWHHIVAVRDATADTMKIYVDGVLENVRDNNGTLDQAFTISGANGDVELGRLPGSTMFWYGGVMDEVAIYNAPLSATVIDQHAQPAVAQPLCNAAPVIDSTEITEASQSVPYSYTATATDPEGHTITWKLTTAPNLMSIDSTTGVVTWTPTVGGTENVTIQATDQFGAADTQSFTITVAGTANADPVITTTAPANAAVGTLYSYPAAATDANDAVNTLVWSLTGEPAGMIVDTATGAVTWTPAAGSEGDYTFTLAVTDPNGGVASQNIAITVTTTPITPATGGGGGGGGGGCFILTSMY